MARLRKAFLILGLALALAVVAAVVWREALVEEAARRVLAANGLGEARLEVVAVGPEAVVIEDLSLGPDLPGARRVRLTYAPGELLSGRLRKLRIEGLRYTAPADIEAALRPLGGLASGGGEGGRFTPPRIEIEDGLLTLAAPLPGTVAVDGALDLSGAGAGGVLDIALDLGAATGAFTLRSEAFGEGGTVEIHGDGAAELAGVTLAGVPFTAGLARLTLDGAVRIPASGESWKALRPERAVALSGGLELAGVTSARTPGTLTADIGWSLLVGKGRVRLGLPRAAALAVTGVAAETLAALGLAVPPGTHDLEAGIAASDPLVSWAGGSKGGTAELAADLWLALGDARAEVGVTAKLDHEGLQRLRAPPSFAANGEASGWSLALGDRAATLRRATWSVTGSVGPDGEVTLAGPLSGHAEDVRFAPFSAAALSADGAIRLSVTPGGWSLHAEPDLAISAEDAAVAGRLALSGPLALTVETLDLDMDGETARLDLEAAAGPFSGTLLSGADEIAAFADAAGRIGLAARLGERLEGHATLAEASVTLPGYDVAASAIDARLPLGGETAPVSLSTALRDTSRVARFRQLDLDLEGSREGDSLAFSGTASMAGGVRLPLEGSSDLSAVTGRMAVGPARLAFARGGLQPAALVPGLAALGEAAGAVTVRGDVSLRADGEIASGATLDLESLTVQSGALAASGLAGRLRLARLFPLATAGAQELTAESVTAGVPLDRARARFSAEARGRGYLIRIEEATAALAGGTVLVRDARWDTGAPSNAVDVTVQEVRLSELLSDWHIQGVSGTGRLSGTVPVRLGPEGVAVADGHLEAGGPGVIHVDWGAARDTLMNSGDQVALTVRALEDFRYDSLSIGVDQPPEGDLSLAIGLEGANPEVLDGHPFRFNITLGGELAPILAAMREGRRIGTELLRGGLGGQ